ncbi:uncharacterized protein PRD47_019400 isoform 1-T1 [Ara ararauna]
MMKYLLFKDLGPNDLPALKQLTTNEICKVWAGTSKYIRKQLSEKKAVDIRIGTFALVLVHAKVGEDKVLPVERPVFQLCRFMKKFYKLKCAKTKIPKEIPFVQLDFEQIGADIRFRQEIVEQCIHETLLFFAGAIRDKREVELSFRSVGILAVRRSAVSMTFFDDCLLELDTTGNMQAALLGNPKMMRIVAFAGKNDYSRLSQDGVIVLPRLVVVIPHQASDHVMSLKPRRESAPWGRGARRGNVPAECWQGAVGAHLIFMKAGESRSLCKVWERRSSSASLHTHPGPCGRPLPEAPRWSHVLLQEPSSSSAWSCQQGWARPSLLSQAMCVDLRRKTGVLATAQKAPGLPQHFSLPPSGEFLLPAEVRQGAGNKTCPGVAGGSVGVQSWSRPSVGKGQAPWNHGSQGWQALSVSLERRN